MIIVLVFRYHHGHQPPPITRFSLRACFHNQTTTTSEPSKYREEEGRRAIIIHFFRDKKCWDQNTGRLTDVRAQVSGEEDKGRGGGALYN